MNYLFDAGLAVGGSAYTWIGGAPMRMARVRHSADCILVMEEGATTITDGCTIRQAFSGGLQGQQSSYVSAGMDLAAVRHGSMGRPVHLRDTTYLPADGDFDNVPNPQGMSNAGFCDGHAETVTRDFIHSPALHHWDPVH